MDLKRPLLVLALAGSLVACGDDAGVQPGETDCDSGGAQASTSQDAVCAETGAPQDGGY